MMQTQWILYALIASSLPLQAANLTTISRYASVNNQPLAAQINPLKAVQQIHFPLSVQTLGEAVDYWLRYSGYHLMTKAQQNTNLTQLFQQPLPQVNRHLGPLTIADGLTVLVGAKLFALHQDDLRREIDFRPITKRTS